MAAGNVEAIRDWSNKYFYSKDEVDEFFVKSNAGLLAYKFTIIDTPSNEISVTEDASTNPQTYTFETGIDGIYTGLFFFHSGSTLTFNDGSGQGIVYELDELIDIIYLTDPVIATPVMTSNTTPSGACRASSVYSQGGSSANWEPWHAFTQVADLNGWVPANNLKIGQWIEYEFSNKVPVIKIDIKNRTHTPEVAPPSMVKIQASNDGTNYVDLADNCIITNTAAGASNVFELKNTNSYLIYRILIIGATTTYSYVCIGCINLYTPDIS